jgi:hypothetical protein
LVGAFFLFLGICKLHGALHVHEKVIRLCSICIHLITRK